MAHTHELNGRALDWAVAYARALGMVNGNNMLASKMASAITHDGGHYSSDYIWGGPIIDEAGIATRRHPTSNKWYAMSQSDAGGDERMNWSECSYNGGERYGTQSYQVNKRRKRFEGETRLVAALRCYVAAIVGPSIDVPQSMLDTQTANSSSDLNPGTNSTVEIQHIPVLSTGHMPSSHAPCTLDAPLFDVAEYEHGFFICSNYFSSTYDDSSHAPDDIEDWIKPIAEYMRKHDLGPWLRLDSDGAVVDTLPNYEW